MEQRKWNVGSGATPAVQGGAALEHLFELNRIYLRTLTETAPRRRQIPPDCPLSGWIASVAAQLDTERKLALSRCPFSLFDLRFSDDAFWSDHARRVGEPVLPGDARPGAESGFMQLALFYAWHLVRADALAARIALGLTDSAQATLMELPLPGVQQLAVQSPRLLSPRWPDRDSVWKIILGAAHRGPECMAEIRLLGIQLIAGDLANARRR